MIRAWLNSFLLFIGKLSQEIEYADSRIYKGWPVPKPCWSTKFQNECTSHAKLFQTYKWPLTSLFSEWV